MACRLSGAKPLSEPMLDYCKLDPSEQICIQDNEFENVCKIAAILFHPQCLQ